MRCIATEHSRRMSSIRSKETKPEILLRKCLWKIGVRGYRKYPNLPGQPDILLPAHKIVVFVDGCFWHGCPTHYKQPLNNAEYWANKIALNKKRDRKINAMLGKMGYRIVRIWQHKVVSDPEACARMIKRAIDK